MIEHCKRTTISLAAGLFCTVLCFVSVAQGQILKNGGLEADEGGNHFPGWEQYLWEGNGDVVRTDGVAFAGKHAAIIQGSGPGKIALFQTVDLKACTYRLTAMVASYAITPGTWDLGAVLHIAFDDGTNSSHGLPQGDSGWRRVTLIFTVPADRKVTIYFFNYGGGSLFVDDVTLESDAPCGTSTPGFAVSESDAASLAYTPPFRPEDRLLAGYCQRADFKDRQVCKRLESAPPEPAGAQHAAEPKLLADFTDLSPFEAPSILPFKPSWSYEALGGGRRAVRLKGGSPLFGDRSTGIPENWAGYDWLEIEVENLGTASQTLVIEIRDDKTTDYWSRVNWESSIPPGRSTAFVPLQAFVGEKSVIKERRRLDLQQITRLVLLTAEKSNDLLLHALRLQADKPYANDFPELIKLDLGPPTAPVEQGFTALDPAMSYRPERGYGLSPDVRIGRVEDRRHPDDLLRDWISFNKGGLDFDLPNDTYEVWMMLEDPGYWDHYPSFMARRVSANDRVVLDELRSEQDFLSRYFRHADDEDLPGDDIWQRYISTRYVPLKFEVEVKDGHLKLRFDSFEDPHAVTVSSLIIYPKSQASRGEAFLTELWDRLKRDFNREYIQVLPAPPKYPKTAGNALDGALSIFQRPIALDVAATDWPAASENVSNIAMTMAQNERSVLMVGLYAHADLALTSAELQLGDIKQKWLLVCYKATRINQDGTAYSSLPRVLDPLEVSDAKPLSLPAGRARSIWFDLNAGELKPGLRTGTLKLGFAGGKLQEIPVSVDISPWRLPEADIPIGYLGVSLTYPGTKYTNMAKRKVSEMEASLRLLRDHGFSGVTGGLGGPAFEGYAQGRLSMDYKKADLSLAAIKSIMGPVEVNTYGGLEIQGLPSNPTDQKIEEYKRSGIELTREILRSVQDHGQSQNWPPLIESIGDEPSGDEIDRVANLGRRIRGSGTSIRTGVFTSIDQPGSDPTAKLAGAVDRLYLNHHSLAAIQYVLESGSECALYNQVGRYRRGAYLFKMKLAGCPGMLRFAWSSVHADPWYDLDGRESDYSAVYAHPDGELRLSVDFFRLRESINDYRQLLKVAQAVATAPAGPARHDAQRWLDGNLARMPIGTGMDQLDPAQLDTLRREADVQLRKLTGASALTK